MKRRWTRFAAGVLCALLLAAPALADTVELDRNPLPAAAGWVENGTSCITLLAYAQATGCALSWDGHAATLNGNGLSLSAAPGALYITVNGRALYVAGGVRVVGGRTVLPLRVLAQATGASLTWNVATQTAALDTSNAVPASANYNADDLYWLSRVISAESGGEPLLGQIAVGNVVLNRVKHADYPNTIQGVVFDDRYAIQFEPVANGSIYNEPEPSAVIAAKLCLEGANVVGNSIYFYAPALSAGSWIVKNGSYYTTIGCHKFYE